MEIIKALTALQPLHGRSNVEIVTSEGNSFRGTILSMKTTQALTRPSVKVKLTDGKIEKIFFDSIVKIIDHN